MASENGAPVFVKVDDYKDVLELVNLLKAKLVEARDTINDLYELKNEEDAELDLWNTEMEEIERKINFVDKSLFEPKM
ncbi:hypothetical protein K9M79_03865 [Candidatus Woesearchaeota archaeon]|nr:hypothetical protein [Candidatus Woesearchaeota archaeon]